ncbi:MAG: hypothetical protein KF842_14675 [Caulobacter sp.]|nr:hypothetical protein [Caulobacter sp.]
MAAQLTLERILRDDDDASGQTIRVWRLSIDGQYLRIQRSGTETSSSGLLIRVADVPQLIADLKSIAAAAETLETPADD